MQNKLTSNLVFWFGFQLFVFPMPIMEYEFSLCVCLCSRNNSSNFWWNLVALWKCIHMFCVCSCSCSCSSKYGLPTISVSFWILLLTIRNDNNGYKLVLQKSTHVLFDKMEYIQFSVIQLENVQLTLHAALIINAKRYIFSILMGGMGWNGSGMSIKHDDNNMRSEKC